MPIWSWLVPLSSAAVLVAALFAGVGAAMSLLSGVALIAAVLVAVHHAEVVAHRLGEPFGTLVLALAVTAIEAALILSMVGICVLVGALRHGEQTFRVEGAGQGLAALMVMAVLTLVLPVFTTSAPAGSYNVPQLAFVALSSAALWAIFIFVQTVRHRDYFIPESDAAGPDAHAAPPTARAAWTSFFLLLVSLVVVVGLAKVLSPAIEGAVAAAEAPRIVVGIVIAALVLLPETWAAVRAARADRLQASMNLAIGSALACIGLTVPIVVLAAIALELPLVLGLEAKDMGLLALTLLVSAVTLGTGRTYVMQGAVHLVLFAAFLFLAFVP
jgi:Ca2+:H+ antiporter